MTLYVVSDLHLGEGTLARMFRDEDQGRRFTEVCDRVSGEADGELVLLGDVFDLHVEVAHVLGAAGDLAAGGKGVGHDLVQRWRRRQRRFQHR